MYAGPWWGKHPAKYLFGSPRKRQEDSVKMILRRQVMSIGNR
jgi:hypothetical protein